MQKAHLINKRWLKRELGMEGDDLWTPDLWVWGCWDHHQSFDSGFIPVPRYELPDEFLRKVLDLGDRAVDQVRRDFRLTGDFAS